MKHLDLCLMSRLDFKSNCKKEEEVNFCNHPYKVWELSDKDEGMGIFHLFLL